MRQFSRQRYNWAKDQWPNLSDRITTVWTLQELGLIPDEIDVKTIVAITERNDLAAVEIHTHGPTEEVDDPDHVGTTVIHPSKNSSSADDES